MTQGNYSGERGQFDEFVDPSGKSITGEVATAAQVSTGDAHAVVNGGTWQDDAAPAIENNQVVILKGSFTHDGTGTVNISPSNHRYVFAEGATFDCRGKMVRRTDSSGSGFYDASFNWFGGQFNGSQASGEVPFHLSDALGDHIFPHRITDCEVGVAVDNREEWSEIFSVGFRGRDNLCALAMVGTDKDSDVGGSYPSGCSLSDPPDDNTGTWSFRDAYVDLWASPRNPDNGWSTSYGFWTDTAKPYEGNLERVSVNVDDNVVGFRMHENFEAARIHFWSETPGGKQNGTAIQVDEMIRSPNWIGGHIVTAGGTTKITGSESKPLLMEMAEKTGSGGVRFGAREEIDGSTLSAWIDEGSGDVRREYESNYRLRLKNDGGSGKPTLELGDGGAGLYVNGSGEVVAVDESGSSTTLT